MIIYVIRHGVTLWNRIRKIQGTADVPLDREGIELARITGEALRKEVSFDICFSSPLQRALSTAEYILGGAKVPVVLDDRLKEIDFGVLEGNFFKDDQGRLITPELEVFFERPLEYRRPEGGEDIRDVLKRTKDFWDELTAREDLKESTVLVSSHGCAVRALLQNLYKDPENFWHGSVPPNCGVNIVEVKDGNARFLAEDKVFL